MANSVGRPKGGTIYKDTYPEQLKEMMSQGMLNCEIWTEWGIHKDTFYQWMYDHPDLKEAYEIGKPACESWWVRNGREGALKGGKGFSYWVAIMNNKFGWVPGNKQPDSQVNNTIHIGNVNVLQSNTQLIDSIRSLALKHSDIVDLEILDDNNQASDVNGSDDRPQNS